MCMKIFVCQRSKVSRMTSKVDATHLLSILDPGKKPFLHPMMDRKNHLLIHCEDNLEEDELHSPTKKHVARILDWSRNLPEEAVVLVCCEAGVSRSTAAALSLLIQNLGIDKIEECVKLLLEVRPTACPNSLISRFADELLKCEGRLFAASEQIVANRMLIKFGVK